MRKKFTSIYYFIGLLTMVSLLTSCSKDDDVGPGGSVYKLDARIFSTKINGVYEVGVPLNEENYIYLYVYADEAGKYEISTPLQNGYRFSGSGEITSAGEAEIILQGEGTPETEQIDSIKIASSFSEKKKGIQVLSGLSDRIIIATGGDSFDDIWNTLALTGRGELLWEAPGYTSFAEVENDVVYFDGVAALTAMDIKTGDVIWENDSLADLRTITLSDNVVYAVTEDADCYAVDGTDGSILWRIDGGSSFTSHGAPVVGDELIYYTQGSTLHAFQKTNGALRWEAGDVTHHGGTSVLADGILYVPGGFYGIYALNISDGSIAWQNEIQVYGSVSINGNHLYVNGDNDVVYCLDKQTGDEVWSSPIEELAKSPYYYDGKVYVTTDFGFTSIYTLDASTGEVLWEKGSFGFARSEMVAQDGMLYLGSTGALNGYYLNTGARVSEYGSRGSVEDTFFEYDRVMVIYNTESKTAAYPTVNGH